MPGSVCGQTAMTMDWMATFLAAAAAKADPAYPLDGIDLTPVLTGAAPVHPRTLYWRYKANWQRTVRDGDLKYLKILDNEFLFNVVSDQMERANLKDRRAADFARLMDIWARWNAGMLPETAQRATDGFTGAQLADHIGAKPVSHQPDPGLTRHADP